MILSCHTVMNALIYLLQLCFGVCETEKCATKIENMDAGDQKSLLQNDCITSSEKWYLTVYESIHL